MPLSDSNLWKPALYIDPNLRRLLRPVTSLTVIDKWKFNESKVPLKDGVSISGHAFDGVRIRVSGSIGINSAGAIVATEIGMFDAYNTFRGYMDLSSNDSPYEFFIYHDTGGGGTYRKFKNVWPVSMSMDLGDDNEPLFKWSAEWITEDSTIYTTAPGA